MLHDEIEESSNHRILWCFHKNEAKKWCAPVLQQECCNSWATSFTLSTWGSYKLGGDSAICTSRSEDPTCWTVYLERYPRGSKLDFYRVRRILILWWKKSKPILRESYSIAVCDVIHLVCSFQVAYYYRLLRDTLIFPLYVLEPPHASLLNCCKITHLFRQG